MRALKGRPERLAWVILACLAIVVFAVGCGDDDDDGGGDGEALTEVGEGEGELNLVAWAGYVEDGATDPKVDWVSDFEKETGCKVSVKYGATSDEMVQLMRTGQYDGVSASGDASGRLYEGGDVDPVNVDLVPNYADVFPALTDQPHNTFDGENYGVPHGRGSNLLAYNTDEVQPAPTSWGVAGFDPEESESYKGTITAYDNPIYIADAAVYLMEHNPELGITDPYELDEEQFNAAVDLLKQQREYIGEYWSDALKQISAFESGDTQVGTTWQYQINTLQGENEPVDAVLPDEGATGWSDTWMLSSEAEHPNCMYLWMNHILDPEVNAQVAVWFGEAPANQKSCELTGELDPAYFGTPDHCEVFHADDEEFFDQVYEWKTPVSDCGDDRGDVCKTYDEWVQAWTEIKG
jgi:putative spermidine/putrescine transport system substrate-binding protein